MNLSDPKAFTVWMARAIAYVLYAWLILAEIVLVQGFFLKLFGANTSADYTQWAYRSLDRVMAPFRGIFTSVELDGNAVLDPSILFAMMIYGIIALVVRAGLDWLNYRLRKLEIQREREELAHTSMAFVDDPAGLPGAIAPE